MSQDEASSKLYALEAASRILGGTSVWSLRKHIAQGNVTATRLGRRVFIRGEEIERIRQEGLPSLRPQVLVGQRK